MQTFGPELGIEMIAANRGIIAGQAGTGWQFWDEGNPIGNRSWAVFRFHSASMGKFDCMVFMVSGGSGVSNSPMNIGTNTAPFTVGNCHGNMGIAFGVHPSGSNTGSQDGPWNGSYSLTSASIGASGSTVSTTNPVWKLNDQQRGAFFPRANGLGGTFSGSRNYMANVQDDTGGQQTMPYRYHILLSEDSITTLIDPGNDQSYKVNHFGPYLVRSGVQAHAPYVFIHNGNVGNQPWGAFYSTKLGLTAGAINTIDGAIAHPDLISGSRNVGLVTYTVANIAISYTNFINAAAGGGAWEKYPVWASIGEGTDNAILGVIKHISMGFGMNNQSVSTISGTAAFGIPTPATNKMLIPWSGSAPGSYNGVRTGRNMNFDRD